MKLPIVEKLKLLAHPNAEILGDADRINRMVKAGSDAARVIEALAEALEPLGNMDAIISKDDEPTAHAFDSWPDDRVVFDIGKDRKITAGNLRAARAALALVKGQASEDGA